MTKPGSKASLGARARRASINSGDDRLRQEANDEAQEAREAEQPGRWPEHLARPGSGSGSEDADGQILRRGADQDSPKSQKPGASGKDR